MSLLPRAIAILEQLEDTIDQQTYDARLKADFDDPDDREYNVYITMRQYRAIGRVLRDYQSNPEGKSDGR